MATCQVKLVHVTEGHRRAGGRGDGMTASRTVSNRGHSDGPPEGGTVPISRLGVLIQPNKCPSPTPQTGGASMHKLMWVLLAILLAAPIAGCSKCDVPEWIDFFLNFLVRAIRPRI